MFFILRVYWVHWWMGKAQDTEWVRVQDFMDKEEIYMLQFFIKHFYMYNKKDLLYSRNEYRVQKTTYSTPEVNIGYKKQLTLLQKWILDTKNNLLYSRSEYWIQKTTYSTPEMNIGYKEQLTLLQKWISDTKNNLLYSRSEYWVQRTSYYMKTPN